jgi:site-specific DNA-methyltransferase (adenine-specific)
MVNKIIKGDSRELLKQLEDESIDCIVSDIPYKIIAGGNRVVYEDEEGNIINKDYSKTDPKGVLGRGRIVKKVVSDGHPVSNKGIKKDGSIPCAVKDGKMFDYNDIEPKEYLEDLYRVLKKGTHCYLMINGRNLANLQKDAEEVGFVYQNLLIWDRGNLTPNRYYMQGAEFILMLSKRPHRPINDMGSSNIIKIPNEVGKKEHPTQKPVALYNYLIKNSTNRGDIVLDPFAGRGTIAMSCIQLDRKYIGFEIDDDFYQMSLENIKKAKGEVGLFA